MGAATTPTVFVGGRPQAPAATRPAIVPRCHVTHCNPDRGRSDFSLVLWLFVGLVAGGVTWAGAGGWREHAATMAAFTADPCTSDFNKGNAHGR